MSGRTTSRIRARAGALLLIAAAVTLASTAAGGNAASSSTVVSMAVPSATSLDSTGCLPSVANRTSLGTVLPGTGAVTTLDCDVLFGSSNDSSTLRAYQPDGRGSAMAKAPTTMTGAGSSAGYRFIEVDMATASVGWAIGDGNTADSRIYKTLDGGVTWAPVVGSGLGTVGGMGVDAVDANVAWAVGNNSDVVVRTTNGTNWAVTPTAPLPTAGGTVAVTDVAAFNDQIAWALGKELIGGVWYARAWRTTNAGTTWTAVHASGTANTWIIGGVAFSATHVWIADGGEGMTYRADNGVTFNAVGPTLGSIVTIAGMNADRVAVVSGSGDVRVYTFAGVWSWNGVARQLLERTSTLGLAWSPNGDLWTVGVNGSVQRSSDQGVTWTVVAQPHESGRLWDVSSPAAGQAVVVSSGRAALATSDNGVTWSAWRAAGSGTNFRAVEGVDSSRVWRVGHLGLIETSTDGGITFTAQASPVTVALSGVVGLDRSIGIAVGANGTIVRTTNGGTNWNTVTSGTTARLRAISVAPNGSTVFAAGDAGTLLRSNDYGASWTSITTGVTTPIWAVAAWSSSNLIIGTADTIVRTSTDGGATWTTRASGALEAVADVIAVPGTSTAHVLWDDNVSTTTDGGATWSSVEISSSGQSADLDLAGSTTLWMTGEGGRVQRSTDSGATWSSTFSGVNAGLAYQGIAALGEDAAVTVSEGGRRDYSIEAATVPDYTGTEWGSSGGMFGICLRSIPGAVNTWPTTGSCPQADGTNWRAVPLNAGLAAAKVGDLAAPGTTTASFRFGLFAPSVQSAGTYRAPIAFEVIAPSG